MSKNELKNPDPVLYIEDNGAIKQSPHICPICNGRGFLMGGFYSSFNGGFTHDSIEKEICLSCKGTGIVWG